MKRPLRLGEAMRDEQGWHATDCQPVVRRRSIRVRQIHKRVKTLRMLVGATGFEPTFAEATAGRPTFAEATAGRPATPCAQGELGRPLKVLISERFAASENSWAQLWAHSSGHAL